MADLEQGIKYTIEADASKAEKAVEDVGKSAAENGQKIEKAMAGASAVTSALNGNFVGAVASLGRMTKAVSGLGKVIAGATGWVAIIGAVIGVFHKWREKIAETKAKIEEFKQARFDEHIAGCHKVDSVTLLQRLSVAVGLSMCLIGAINLDSWMMAEVELCRTMRVLIC